MGDPAAFVEMYIKKEIKSKVTFLLLTNLAIIFISLGFFVIFSYLVEKKFTLSIAVMFIVIISIFILIILSKKLTKIELKLISLMSQLRDYGGSFE